MVQGITGGGTSGISPAVGPYVSPIAGNGQSCKETIESYFGDRPIFLPKGVYTIPDTIDIPVGDTGVIKGVGGDVTLGLGSVIKLANGVNGRVLNFAEPGGGIYHRGHILEDFYIDANKAGQGAGDYAIYAPKFVRCVMRNMGVYNAYGEAIRLTGLTTITAYHNQLFGVKAFNSNGAGIHTVLSDENWLTDCTTQANGAAGLYITNGNIIKGHVSVNDYQGLRCSGSGTIYTNFILDTMDREGILLETNDRYEIGFGHIHRASNSANNTYDGIRGTNAMKAIIYGVEFTDAGGNVPKYCIESGAGCDYWALDRISYVQTPGTGDRSLTGANNTVGLEWT